MPNSDKSELKPIKPPWIYLIYQVLATLVLSLFGVLTIFLLISGSYIAIDLVPSLFILSIVIIPVSLTIIYVAGELKKGRVPRMVEQPFFTIGYRGYPDPERLHVSLVSIMFLDFATIAFVFRLLPSDVIQFWIHQLPYLIIAAGAIYWVWAINRLEKRNEN